MSNSVHSHHQNSLSGGRNPARAPEKSNFAQTCHLLSQYLKEKRSLGITPTDGFPATRPPSTMNLLTNMENPDECFKDKPCAPAAAAPMTIFYGGRVMVFNDLCPERAEEIMAMAGKGIAASRSAATVSDKGIESSDGNGSNLAGEQTKPSGDMPIARRTSLHRFFEKRKDRVAARAPYQVNQQQQHSVYSKKFSSDEGNSKQFDLNL